MAFPLIAAGVAAAAGWFLSGCAVADEEPQEDPCGGVDCSGHGVCVPTSDAYVCVCERGYYQDGPECLPDVVDRDTSAPDAGPADDVDAGAHDADVTPDEDVAAHEDAAEVEVPDAGGAEAPDGAEADSSCPSPACVSERAFACAGPEGKTKIVSCDEKHRCEEGACVVKPELVDPNCGGNYYSVCRVTDEYEVGVDDGRWVYLNDGFTYLATTFFNPEYGCDTYSCTESSAQILPAIYGPGDEIGKDRWPSNWTMQMAMAVNLKAPASYFKVDAKMDWTTMTPWPDECGPIEGALGVRETTIFGQWPPATNSATKRIYRLDDGNWMPCEYATVAIYLSHKTYDGNVNLIFQNFGRYCVTENPYRWHQNYIAMAKVRTTSCECFE